MENDCTFCRIISGKIKTKIEKETENFIVFEDIHPQAPVHFLIVPKKHIKDIIDCNDPLWIEVKKIALDLAGERSITGFRLVTNAGTAALVKHFHIHFLGGISAERKIIGRN